ncbi:MAG TPA: vanadium-dependent haloperoxidase [Actinomycetota bacterium]|jgi:hypothetical protein
MSRKLAVIIALVFCLVAATVGSAAADLLGGGGDDDDVLPLPALPIGPGPPYPLDAYGPRPDDNVVLRWDEQTLAAIRAVKQGPTINARALAIVHTAMYDAWAAYDPVAVGTRLGGSLRQPPARRTLSRQSKAISYAAYRSLLNLYPSRAADFTAFMKALGYNPNNGSTEANTAAGVGNAAAAAVLAFRANDGSNQAGGYADTSGYVPVNTPDQVNDVYRWQPLRLPDGKGGFVVQKFLTPHWRSVTPFALTSPDEFLQPGPQNLSLLLLDKEVDETIVQSAALTDVQKTRIEYWADGPSSETPPGHWCLFAQAISRKDGHTLDQDAKLFFALANAELDASIVAWNAKRRWDYVRPITAVRERRKGQLILAWGGPYQGTRLIRAENYLPYQPATSLTPPFPEYVSGHSTFSAAGARVLRSFTGSDLFGARVTIPRGSSRIEPGAVPALPTLLTWPTYTSALDEAGNSRRQGGIHFLDADLGGRALGDEVGANAWTKALSLFRGDA